MLAMLPEELLLEEELLLREELLFKEELVLDEEPVLEEEPEPMLLPSRVFPPQAARSTTIHMEMPTRGLRKAALRGDESNSIWRPPMVVCLRLGCHRQYLITRSAVVPPDVVASCGKSHFLADVPV